MIPEEVVEQVRQSADIVQIIGEYVSLKKMGTSYRGPCPFHQGTNRNFSVDPRKGFYHCFVCNESGTVFTFLQKRLGLSYPDAVKMAGEKAGIEVREVQSNREGPDPREPMWELNATTSSYFQNILWNDPLGAQAREYLAQRNISRELADKFGLGFAPREIGLMRSYLNTLGFDDQRLLDAGLLTQPEDGAEFRPRFRGRLIFPIFDVLGRNVGFGGRVIGQGEPKYLNSPETSVFSKGKLLYGLNWAKNDLRRDDRALVVEGYFDVVRLVAAGVTTAVAPLGTALTDAQAALLTKYTKNVYLLYDSDKAGLKATFRAGDELLRQKASVRVVTLPQGEDPDTFVSKHGVAGANGLETQIAQSVDVFDRKVQILERAGWFVELQKKRRALDRLLPTIRATADPILRDIYIGRTSEVTGVAKDILLREVGSSERQSGRPQFEEPRAVSQPSSRRIPQASVHASPGVSAERALLIAMLGNRSWVDVIGERFSPGNFIGTYHGRIFNALVEKGQDATISQLADSLDPEEAIELERLYGSLEEILDLEKTVSDSIARIVSRDVENRIKQIDREFSIATGEQKDKMMKEKERLRDEMNALGQKRYKTFRK